MSDDNQVVPASDQNDPTQARRARDYRLFLKDEDEDLDDDQVQFPVGRVDKESGPISPTPPEFTPSVEVGEQELPLEIQEYMEKVDKENLELERPVVYHGQNLVQAADNEEEVELPIGRNTMIRGLKEQVTASLRWLATWCLRIVKKFRGRVVFSSEGHMEPEQHSG